MPTDSNTDILICGAGAAGLTLAIELARRGVDFRLVELLDEPFHGSPGQGLPPSPPGVLAGPAVGRSRSTAPGVRASSRAPRKCSRTSASSIASSRTAGFIPQSGCIAPTAALWR